MKRALLFVPLILCVIAVPRVSRAQAEALAEAQGMVERQEYDEAQEALTDVLQSGELDPTQVVAVYRGLAECAAALRRPDEARDAFLSLLVLEPEYYISSDESPLLREPFEQAQAHWGEHERPSVGYEPPAGAAEEEPFVIDLELDNQTIPGLLDTARLHLRRPDGDFATREMRRGHVEIPSGLFSDADEIRFYLTIHDEFGNTVALAGSAESPLSVPVGEGAAPTTERTPSDRRWYQTWWFWTIVGVVVVGVAVGVPVGLTAGSSDDPCETALGGRCDLEVNLGQ